MYNVKLTQDETDRIRSGDTALLIKKLEEGDMNLTSALKKSKDNLAFYQGASHVVDALLKTLRGYLH